MLIAFIKAMYMLMTHLMANIILEVLEVAK